MLLHRFISVFFTLRQIDQVDQGVEVLKILAQIETVELRQVRIQKGYVDLLLPGGRQGLRAVLKTQDPGILRVSGQLLLRPAEDFFFLNCNEYSHRLLSPYQSAAGRMVFTLVDIINPLRLPGEG